jgi:hypothetical protein
VSHASDAVWWIEPVVKAVEGDEAVTELAVKTATTAKLVDRQSANLTSAWEVGNAESGLARMRA